MLVTLTPTEVVDVARYIDRVSEAEMSLAGCNLIDWSGK